ncbi:MAG: threonine--tRNA ligase [Patescibacteria group bacterium]|nr:threonine--tRNA ligase [Patescibacteria group bacterium]
MSYSIEQIRHSAAHVMAAAIQKLFPNAKFGVGPAVDNGFYYDIDIGRTVTPEDLREIQKEMQKLANKKLAFERQEMSADEAIVLFEKLNQPFKVELLNDIKTKGTTKLSAEEAADVDPAMQGKVSVYTTGDFTDLCRGPHVEDSSQIGAFKVWKMAGAFWRGKETNPQLQRIYGLCFATQEELDAYEAMMAEAEKRDHKKLGKELGLFSFSDLVGSGLPLWSPKGTILRTVLDEYVWELRKAKGFTKVAIPHITKKDLYVKSGHWAKFKDELFKIVTRENHEFALKPMNCPHHTQIFDSEMRSYRDMPQRYAETTMVYRDEQTGELSGLSRVRCITQDDAHVFCRKNQIEQECFAIWDIIDVFYKTFGFELNLRLSTHDPDNFDKYLGTPEVWQEAESQLKSLIEKRGVSFVEGKGEAAMYGPKLDFMGKDALGRLHQVATIQLDFNMPVNFDLNCVNEKGEKEGIVMIHCAIMGSIERFLSVLIEHYAGAFPLWLAPVQVSVLPVADRHVDAAIKFANELKEQGMRVEVDDSTESVGKKIRNAEKKKMPCMIVYGDKEMDGELTVRWRGVDNQETLPKAEFVEKVLKLISERS